MNNEPMQEAAATIHVPHVCRTWNDALNSAEAAVTAMPYGGGGQTIYTPSGFTPHSVVAAIRALKEKP